MDNKAEPQSLTNNELLPLVLTLDSSVSIQEKANLAAVNIPADKWLELAPRLKLDSRFLFDMLCDHTAIDWPEDNTIELIYELYSTQLCHYLMVCVKIQRVPSAAPSVAQIWNIAEWQEREVFDLFGVKYSNHPDLRRIFLEDDWLGHPLLKDYKDDFMLERPW